MWMTQVALRDRHQNVWRSAHIPQADALTSFSKPRSLLQDLVAQGISLIPFFISTSNKPFDLDKFYSVTLFSS
jgi:hypothetical protein